jgi:hypothetical protein
MQTELYPAPQQLPVCSTLSILSSNDGMIWQAQARGKRDHNCNLSLPILLDVKPAHAMRPYGSSNLESPEQIPSFLFLSLRAPR